MTHSNCSKVELLAMLAKFALKELFDRNKDNVQVVDTLNGGVKGKKEINMVCVMCRG